MSTLRRNTVMGLAVVATALGAAWAVGCGDQKQVEQPPQPVVDAGADAAPLPTVTTPAPVVGPCDDVQLKALTTMFPGRVATEAPGMQPEGAPTCMFVPEGQTASSQVFMLQQGYCYTVLGSSLPPVSDIEMVLEVDLAGGATLPPALAALNINQKLLTDTDAGPTGSMGAKQSCYKWPWPIPAAVRVTLTSRGGSGPIAAQVYKKKSL
jgi:hypothetical protein